jgi:hypothetical protein
LFQINSVVGFGKALAPRPPLPPHSLGCAWERGSNTGFERFLLTCFALPNTMSIEG